MIAFPGYLILGIFAAMAVLLTGTAITHFWHALRHGGTGMMSMVSTGVFIGGILVIGWAAWMVFAPVDWSQPFSLNIPGMSSTITPLE